MKIKTLPLVLTLIVTTPLAYAADEILWLDDAKKDVQAKKNVQAEKQPADKPVSQLPADKFTLQLPVDEKALVGKSVAEIVAFAKANPDYAVDIALAAATVAENPEQAATILKAIAAALPDQGTAIMATLEQASGIFSKFQAAINSQLPYSEAVINEAQNIANNIQASANQGKITQAQANALIALIVLRSGGGVITPVSLN